MVMKKGEGRGGEGGKRKEEVTTEGRERKEEGKIPPFPICGGILRMIQWNKDISFVKYQKVFGQDLRREFFFADGKFSPSSVSSPSPLSSKGLALIT